MGKGCGLSRKTCNVQRVRPAVRRMVKYGTFTYWSQIPYAVPLKNGCLSAWNTTDSSVLFYFRTSLR
jgi:hypothetical protein